MDNWHSRGYLPHIEAGEMPQFISYHLAGSVPKYVTDQWHDELKLSNDKARVFEIKKRIERFLDEGHTHKFLINPQIGSLVETAFLFFDGARYRLHAWVIMPNHIHVLVTLFPEYSLSQIIASWKSYTSHEIKKKLTS